MSIKKKDTKIELKVPKIEKKGTVLPDELSEEYKAIYDDLVMLPKDSISLSDVILSDENKEKLEEFLEELSNVEKLRKKGLEPMNRILSYGHTGTGKTLTAKALAHDLGYTMLMVDIAQAIAQGNAAGSIGKIFKLANKMRYCLIFFDEVDSIAWSRDSSDNDGGDMRRATNALFQYMDQMDDTNIYIACTNMLPRLDPAFERRFDLKLEFTRPDIGLKQAIQRFIPEGYTLDEEGVSEHLAEVIQKRMSTSTSISYYGIESITKRAVKKAVLRDVTKVSLLAIYEDFKKLLRITDRTDRDIPGQE